MKTRLTPQHFLEAFALIERRRKYRAGVARKLRALRRLKLKPYETRSPFIECVSIRGLIAEARDAARFARSPLPFCYSVDDGEGATLRRQDAREFAPVALAAARLLKEAR